VPTPERPSVRRQKILPSPEKSISISLGLNEGPQRVGMTLVLLFVVFFTSRGAIAAPGTLATKADTTITVTSSVNPSVSGQSVILTATISPTAPATLTPTGTVQFVFDNSSVCGPVTLDASGQARIATAPGGTCGTSPLPVGLHTVTVQYSGDANYNANNGELTGGQTVSPQSSPTPVATATATTTPAATTTPTPNATATATPAQALNVSTRLRVDTGDEIMIGGFIIRGNAPKPVVLRGMGPSLANAGVPTANVLNDPILELHGPNGALVTSNDNWKDSPQKTQIQGTIFEPTDDREAVILATLPPAAYTVLLSGAEGTTGIGLIEVYDNNQALDSDLANISTRGFVQVGDNVMMGGFTLGANTAATNIGVRALGPSLANFSLTNVLADPILELHNAQGTIMISNDDWQSDAASAAQLSAHGLALPNPKESGIFALLGPGQFTAVVADATGGVGIALVEIYNLR
jgi:hypothetical protein